MPKSDNQKGKLLHILSLLQQHSGPGHPLTTARLQEMLEQRGIPCQRKSILADIQALREWGADIITTRGPGGGHYLASREFELPELKLLMDAVLSSRYLTEKKSRDMIRKLCGLCSLQDARLLLNRDVLVSGRVKTMNETIYYNVDAIQEAIAENRQISFRYFDWGLDGQPVYRDRDYTASPYSLCQDNENCYLLAHSPRHGITSYRVDRMVAIRLLEDKRTPCPELTGRALAEHANQLFQMFAGDAVTVKLRFHRSLLNVVIDRFGRDILLIPDGEEWFRFTVTVAVSPIFLSWLIGFGRKAQVLYPQSVAERLQEMCREALAQYSGQGEGVKDIAPDHL